MLTRPGCIIAFLALGLTLALSGSARAAQTIVFDSGVGPADVDNGFGSDKDSDFDQRFALQFELGAAATVNAVQFVGIYFTTNSPPATDDFMLIFYNDDPAGGAIGLPDPGSIFATRNIGNPVIRADTGFDNVFTPEDAPGPVNFDIYEYTANIADLALPANTKLWVSVVNDTTGHADDWLWSSQQLNFAAIAEAARSNSDGVSWNGDGRRPGVVLFETDQPIVPLPVAAWLGAPLLVALGLRRRTRRG